MKKKKSPIQFIGNLMPRHLGNAQYNYHEGGCWGVMSRVMGCCERPARRGKLTCPSHASAESAARSLRGRLDAEIRHWEIDL